MNVIICLESHSKVYQIVVCFLLGMIGMASGYLIDTKTGFMVIKPHVKFKSKSEKKRNNF